MTNAPKREASTAFLKTDNNEVGEHLSAAEVGSGTELVFSS